jgi:hypothetical protein
MKDQAQQPPNPNGATRGAGNAIGSTGAPPPGGKDQSAQPPAPNNGVPMGANAALAPGAGGQSFAQQGFSGVATQPGSSQAAQIAQQAAPTAASPSTGGIAGIVGPRIMDANPTYGSGIGAAGGNMSAGDVRPGYTGTFNDAPIPKITVPGEPAHPSGMPNGTDLTGAMHDAQDAAYKTATGYLDPQFANSQHDLEAKLANQGIPQNSEAWNRAMDEFNRNKTFAYGQAESNAVQQGNAAHGQLFSEGLQGAQFSNTVRQQLVNEGFTQEQIDNLEQQHRFDNSMTMRNQDINELLLQQQNPLQMYQALMGNGQVTPPNFTNTPGTNVGGTDILQAIQQAYGGQLNSYNAATGNANSSNAAMASIIAAIICDRRLKTNVRMIGMHVVGVPLYEFDYVWGEKGIGVMADELEAVKPEAVITLACGYKAVDYARI